MERIAHDSKRAARGDAFRALSGEAGKIKPMVLLWAIGIPLPIVLIIALVRGCI